jgi:Tfp pilus assembly protein PilO
MNELDVQLENLDERLLEYTSKQRLTLYIGSTLSILLMGWMFYVSDSIDGLTAIQDQNSELEKQISENSPESYQIKIATSLKMLEMQKNQTAMLENEKQILMSQMQASQGLLFDNRHYAKILDLLLERSVQSGLKIEFMESEDSNKTFFGKIKQFKKLSISGSGNFNAIADFFSFIEAQNTLVQIESIQIHSDEARPSFNAIVLYMGVAL